MVCCCCLLYIQNFKAWQHMCSLTCTCYSKLQCCTVVHWRTSVLSVTICICNGIVALGREGFAVVEAVVPYCLQHHDRSG